MKNLTMKNCKLILTNYIVDPVILVSENMRPYVILDGIYNNSSANYCTTVLINGNRTISTATHHDYTEAGLIKVVDVRRYESNKTKVLASSILVYAVVLIPKNQVACQAIKFYLCVNSHVC